MDNTQTHSNETKSLPRVDSMAIEQRAQDREASGFWDEDAPWPPTDQE